MAEMERLRREGGKLCAQVERVEFPRGRPVIALAGEVVNAQRMALGEQQIILANSGRDFVADRKSHLTGGRSPLALPA